VGAPVHGTMTFFAYDSGAATEDRPYRSASPATLLLLLSTPIIHYSYLSAVIGSTFVARRAGR